VEAKENSLCTKGLTKWHGLLSPVRRRLLIDSAAGCRCRPRQWAKFGALCAARDRLQHLSAAGNGDRDHLEMYAGIGDNLPGKRKTDAVNYRVADLSPADSRIKTIWLLR